MQQTETGTTQTVNRDGQDLTLTVWSWQVPTPELARDFAEQIDAIAFDSVDFCVRWDKIEPWQGNFDWTYFDSIMDVFVKSGLKINLSLLLWVDELAWKDSLVYQETADGSLYTYEDRGPFLSLNDAKNLEILENTLREFSVHCNEKYASSLIGWQVRTNPMGEIGYTPILDLDYSAAARQDFYDYLVKTYQNISYFGKCFNLKITSRAELEAYDFSKLVRTCDYDWNKFKQQTLVNFVNATAKILKAANPNIPVTMQISGFSDTLSALYRGTFDPYLLSQNLTADLLSVNPDPEVPTDLLLDLLRTTVSQKLLLEVDGAWRGESALNGYIAQVKAAGQSGLKAIRTGDWELEQLSATKNTLQSYSPFFRNAQQKTEASKTVAMLWNTTDFVLQTIPKDQTERLEKAYKTLSKDNTVHVQIFTDTMLLANPTLLDSIQTLYLGDVSKIVYLQDELAELLVKSNCKIYVDTKENFNFLDQFKSPLDDDLQKQLNDKILAR